MCEKPRVGMIVTLTINETIRSATTAMSRPENLFESGALVSAAPARRSLRGGAGGTLSGCEGKEESLME